MTRSPWAFTLVELLVVIAIVAVLLAMVFPTLTKAVHITRQMKCVQHLGEQAKAHVAYGFANKDNKPPIVSGGSRPRPDWVSPNTKRLGEPVGQGLLAHGEYLSFEVLLCPAAAMTRDTELDRLAWERMMNSGSSYAYFWRDPDHVLDKKLFLSGATYDAAGAVGQTALSMDVNAEEGHGYVGEYDGRGWVSHPSMGTVNISFIDCSVDSAPNNEVLLRFPAGVREELNWFDQAHRRGPGRRPPPNADPP